jgi:hypothetical protein
VLVLAAESTVDFETIEDKRRWGHYVQGHDQPGTEDLTVQVYDFEQRLAREAGLDPSLVFLDVPKVPTLAEAGEALVIIGKTDDGKPKLVQLREVYPTSMWANAYGQFKHRAYVFGPEEDRRRLAALAVPLLRDQLGIVVKQEALNAAKHNPHLLLTDLAT